MTENRERKRLLFAAAADACSWQTSIGALRGTRL
jgi:hypothetical protein